MQVGYYICSGSTPVVFTQVWNLNTNALVYGNTFGTTPTTGTHQFAIQVQSGTTWVATFDGQTVGTCNLGSSTSSSTYPVYAMSEENSLAAAIAIPTTAFPVALQVLRSGAWLNPSTVTVYNFGGTWGIEGPVQDASLAPDSFVVGGPLATLSAGTVL